MHTSQPGPVASRRRVARTAHGPRARGTVAVVPLRSETNGDPSTVSVIVQGSGGWGAIRIRFAAGLPSSSSRALSPAAAAVLPFQIPMTKTINVTMPSNATEAQSTISNYQA